MNICYEQWSCGGIWMSYAEDQMLVIKKYNGSILVGIETSDGTIENSCSYAESEYMEAFSDFMNRMKDSDNLC
jgi:hypothetical protein